MHMPMLFFDKKFGCGADPLLFGQCPKFCRFFYGLPYTMVPNGTQWYPIFISYANESVYACGMVKCRLRMVQHQTRYLRHKFFEWSLMKLV